MADALHLIVTVTPKPPAFQEVLESLQGLAKAVEKDESGALIYQVFSNEAQGTVVVYEKYKDKGAYDFHRETQAYKDLMDQSVEKLAQPPQVVVLKNPAGFSKS